MKLLNKLPRTFIALIASIFLAFAPVSKGYIGTSTTGATDNWTYPCGLASYYFHYYSYYGNYNTASSLFYYYNGIGHFNFYTAENQVPYADFHLYYGYSLYYFYMVLDTGDYAKAYGYYYTYQAYAYYYYYTGLGDTATADSLLAYYLGVATAYFNS